MDSFIHCLSSHCFEMSDGVLESMVIKQLAQGAWRVPGRVHLSWRLGLVAYLDTPSCEALLSSCLFQGVSRPFKKWLGNHQLPVLKGLNTQNFPCYHAAELCSADFASYINKNSTCFSSLLQFTTISYLGYSNIFLGSSERRQCGFWKCETDDVSFMRRLKYLYGFCCTYYRIVITDMVL